MRARVSGTTLDSISPGEIRSPRVPYQYEFFRIEQPCFVADLPGCNYDPGRGRWDGAQVYEGRRAHTRETLPGLPSPGRSRAVLYVVVRTDPPVGHCHERSRADQEDAP